MSKWRKKPVVIEAVRWTGNNQDKILELIRGSRDRRRLLAFDEAPHGLDLVIVTLEGEMKADRGDYIIRGIKGEVYPCKPDIFLATYEEVAEDETRADH